MATTSKITIYRGVPYDKTLRIKYKDGTPYNLTGILVFITVKEIDDFTDAEDDSTAIIKLNITEHFDAVNGLTKINIDETKTKVPAKFYKWDIRLYRPASEGVSKILVNSSTGSCEVKNVVTNRIS